MTEAETTLVRVHVTRRGRVPIFWEGGRAMAHNGVAEVPAWAVEELIARNYVDGILEDSDTNAGDGPAVTT